MNITRFDLNLLKIFDAVFREQSVTRAAERLHLSQSAVSNALSRLREQVSDPLFYSTGRGMVPTGKARAIEPAITEALQLMSLSLSDEKFDPRRCEEPFQLALGEYTARIAAPAVIRRLEVETSGSELHLIPIMRQDLLDLIARGDVVAAVLHSQREDSPLFEELLVESGYVVAGRSGNPLLRKRVDIEAYCNAKHIVVSVDGFEDEAVDRQLAKLGLKRNIVGVINHLSVGGEVVRDTDALMTVTPRYLRAFAPWLEVANWPLPVNVEPFRMHLVTRDPSLHRDSEKWFINLLRQELAQAYR